MISSSMLDHEQDSPLPCACIPCHHGLLGPVFSCSCAGPALAAPANSLHHSQIRSEPFLGVGAPSPALVSPLCFAIGLRVWLLTAGYQQLHSSQDLPISHFLCLLVMEPLLCQKSAAHRFGQNITRNFLWNFSRSIYQAALMCCWLFGRFSPYPGITEKQQIGKGT